ncbi:MAG: ABC transporter permease [Actinomycetia bacterium]|nr:ABC transporter permease [Actinomycetes bacterium]
MFFGIAPHNPLDQPASQPAKKPGRRRKLASGTLNIIIGGCVVGVVLLLAVFPQLFTEYLPQLLGLPSNDPYAYSALTMLQPPSAVHWFGTDHMGRDVFARVIFSTRIDLIVGVCAVIVPLIVGSLLGLLAGYYSGKLDIILMRVTDVFMAFPFTLVVIVVVTITGPSITNLFIAMWLVGWMNYARLIRGEVMIAKQAAYVEAARSIGFPNLRIILRHILPNVVSVCVVFAASDVVLCMLAGAAMSFLGLGVQPPTPEWGAIIDGGRAYISSAWWITAFPGIFLAVTGIGFSLIGDGLTDRLRTQGRS